MYLSMAAGAGGRNRTRDAVTTDALGLVVGTRPRCRCTGSSTLTQLPGDPKVGGHFAATVAGRSSLCAGPTRVCTVVYNVYNIIIYNV